MSHQHSDPTSPKADYMHNVAHAHDSKVKFLLYGGEARPFTPVKEGKKTVAHPTGDGAPFATYGAAAAKSQAEGGGGAHQGRKAETFQKAAATAQAAALVGPKTYIAKSKQKDSGAGKIGKAEFDPDVYLSNRAEKASNLEMQKSKAYWGAGDILAFEPKGKGEEDDGHQ